MPGFLGMLAGARSNVLKEQQAQKFQDVLMQQKQAESELDARYKESQIGENNARAESLSQPKQSTWRVEDADGFRVLVNDAGETKPLIFNGQQVKSKAVRDPVADHASNRQYDIQHPLPTSTGEDKTLVPVQGADGSVVYTKRSEAEGQNAPSPNARGNAKILGDISENETQLSVIDDAVGALAKRPGSVGLIRGMADLPLIGGFGDAANQRFDPEGVDVRALIANISSLVIKDRSGAAVTVSESGRLRPFIPSVGDTPDAINRKLALLRKAIQTETDLLRKASGTPHQALGAAAPQGKADAASILAKYGIK